MTYTVRDIRRKLFHYSVKEPNLFVNLFNEKLSIDEASKKLFALDQTKIYNFVKRKTIIEIS